jgi:hypothetical protein
MGIATSSATITTGGTWTNAAVVSNTAGAIFVNNSNSGVGTGGAITAGQTMCVAVDLNAARIWFRNGAAGNWNNNVTYDPATGVGGVSISTVFGAGVQAYGMGWFNSSTNGSYNANFGGSAFIGTVPSGFNSGFIPPVGGGTQPLAMVLA